MTQFVENTLGEVCQDSGGIIQTGPFGSQLHQSDYSEKGIPVVMPADIKNGRIDETRVARVSEGHVERLKRHKLEVGDIVYGRRGDIGRQAIIRSENEGWLCGTGCLRLSLGENPRILPEYLHLYLSMPEVIGWIQNQAIGATMPNLNTQILKRVPLIFPEDLDAQKKIVAIVTAYDDLIENNKRRIALLENMAEEIYREWFVRFRFPGWQEAEFEKGLPASWAVAQGDDLFEVVKGKSYSSEEISDHLNGGRPFINLKNFNRGGGYRSNGLKYFRGEFRDRQQVNRGDVVMAVTDMTQNREVIGRAARVPYLGETDGIISLDVVKISAFSWPDLFTYAHLRYSGISEALKELANGANVLHLKPDLIGKQKYLVPDTPTVEEFVKLVEPFYEQIEKLEQQIDMLEYTKNQLLPRLISGKLFVDNLDFQFPPSMQSDASDSADEAAA